MKSRIKNKRKKERASPHPSYLGPFGRLLPSAGIILKLGEKWMLLCEKGEWIRNRFGKAVSDCLEGFNPSERMIIMVVGDLSRKGRGLKMSLFKDQVDYGEFQV